jgi:hypothetical protein
MQENKSEVALLMRRITLEYEAAQNALTGLACGTSQHEFITARMENIGRFHEELATFVGPEQAIKFVAKILEQGHP